MAIYILSAAFLYIRIYTGPEKEMFRRALLAGAGPIGLLIFISRLACGGRKIFTVFFLFSVYIVFWSGQAVCLLISGKLRKKHLSVLLRRFETGAIIFLITGMLCGREYGERNIYEASVGQQGYGKISEEYTDAVSYTHLPSTGLPLSCWVEGMRFQRWQVPCPRCSA